MTSTNRKLCLIFNIAPHYREAIYKLLEATYDCYWYFGSNDTNIKTMNLSSLRNVSILENKYLIGGKICYRKKLASLISKDEFQTFLLTGETFNLSVWWFLLKAKFFYPSKKVYIWTHGWYGKETLLEKFLKKIYFSLTTGIFLYGNYAKKLMIKEGISERKIHVVHNSLQYDTHIELRSTLIPSSIFQNHFRNNYYNLIFIGRLTSIKRLDVLVEALSNLIDKGFDCNLTFIGDGPERKNLQNLVNEKGIEEYIWFYGASYDEKNNAELIFNADLCVAPGNVGLTAIHSMTFGTPVISHDNFSLQMPEFESIINGVTGSFFKMNDSESLSECIQNWFENHTDRETVRHACYHEIEKSWTPQYQIKVFRENI